MSEFGQAVKCLKEAIAADAHKHLERFREVTGISPSSIGVELIDVTARGDVLRHLVVANVRLSFEDV